MSREKKGAGHVTVQFTGSVGDPRDRLKRKIARAEQLIAELKAAQTIEAQRPLWAELMDLADGAGSTIDFEKLRKK